MKKVGPGVSQSHVLTGQYAKAFVISLTCVCLSSNHLTNHPSNYPSNYSSDYSLPNNIST